jgi:hypothetical protein
MAGSRSARLVEAALRCYPPRWRSRHGDEAAELAAQLMRDGVPARSIACSYFMGAARARLVPGPRRRLGVAAGTLLVAAAALGVPVALLSSSAPASAASVIRARITKPARFTGSARIVVGRAAKPGERYAAAADIFRPGEMLQCSALPGESVRQALPALESLHVKIAWETGNGKPARWPAALGRYYVVGGTALSTDFHRHPHRSAGVRVPDLLDPQLVHGADARHRGPDHRLEGLLQLA